MTLTPQIPAWQQTLCAGHIVSFAFPSAENDDAMEKNRPALILSIDRSGPEPLATVAYGTSRRTQSNTGLELHVRTREDIMAAGLRKRTRFIGARTTTVPLTSARFVTCRAGTAVLGTLPDHLQARLEHVASRCHTWLRKDGVSSHRTHLGRQRSRPVLVGNSVVGPRHTMMEEVSS
jgi:hypothetical protein